MGIKTGVDLGEEVKGLIPTTKYYEKAYGKNWPKGILVSLGIGQGEISATPLQLAFFTALVANNGRSIVPHVVKGYLDENKKIIPLKYPEVNTNISQKTFDIVKQGMFLVVNGSGTATSIKLSDLSISGKTGTAQNPHGKDHAWFICFAPSDKPKIAIAILVENVGFGATWAAPIAKKMLLKYFGKEVPFSISEIDANGGNYAD
jgi:penicillin-binding protein 2